MPVELLSIFFRKPITRNTPEAVVQRCSIKKVFLEISQNPQQNTCARVSFLIKLQASSPRPTLLKKRLWHRVYWTPLVAASDTHYLIIRSVKVVCIWDENTFIKNFHTNYSFFRIFTYFPTKKTDILLLTRLRN